MNTDTKKGTPTEPKKPGAPTQAPSQGGQNPPGSQARPQQPIKK
ncbi:MAG: hypothetical protein QY326_05440 [Bdellovibrionota bacterium]|nr:MAG: hypothetical protein QY326_05440 [Bdellovibrionota bacterium]